jgi:hypothetical protein
MKKRSIAQQIAARVGVSPRTVQRMVRKIEPERPRGWITADAINVENLEKAFEIGRGECYNQPCRYVKPHQLRLFN